MIPVYTCRLMVRLLTGLFVVPVVCAEQQITTVKVIVLAPPPCIINDNQAITVEFGDVMTTRVDGNNYHTQVNYTLDCRGANSNTMKLQVQGNGASFDGSVLRSDKAGLGIKLLQGSNKLPVNAWLNFTYPNKPELWAVPVKQSGVTLVGGEFAATATMKIAYQ